ncbi:hypothetical protein L2088_25860 [Pseudomonas protegens]|uniref:hypothetical protein n=1 Tax=Pseudomonas protegens TaxID=380021 RepID=UPI0020258C77|nr:hypothetical protein [Pseudomonas protegens]MCL9658147.1 hypothetical protein [Pseudomonas protegens]
MPNTEPDSKGSRLLLVVAATLLGSLWQGGFALARGPANSLLPGAVAAAPEVITGTPYVRPLTLPLVRGQVLPCAAMSSAGEPMGVVLWRLVHVRDARRVSCNLLPFKIDGPDSNTGSGKLIELQAFSGKMLDAAVAYIHGTGKIIRDSSGGISPRVDKNDGGSRRILWRQIQ